ncbi:MAG: hypothetical protein ACOY7L_17015 [Pseudomonadota bacterium]
MRHRISSDSAWPLRCADGRTFAERRADVAAQPMEPLFTVTRSATAGKFPRMQNDG